MAKKRTENKIKKRSDQSQDVVGDPETEIIDIIAFFCLCDEVKIPVSVLCFLALRQKSVGRKTLRPLKHIFTPYEAKRRKDRKLLLTH